MTIELDGIPNDSPVPRTAREFLYAQGDSTGASNGRPIVLVGNKTAAGSEVVETLGPKIQDLADCYARFGRRSEIAWKYRVAIMVAPDATYYGLAIAEAGGATASSIFWTFATTADVLSTVRVEWGTKRLEVTVNPGDLATAIATNVVQKINADPDLPFSAATGLVPTAGSETSGAASFPVALAVGDTFLGKVDEQGSATTLTIAATDATATGSGATFATVSAAHFLKVLVSGVPGTQTITFAGTESTLALWLAALNTQLVGAAAVSAAGQIEITTDQKGSGASISFPAGSSSDVLASLGLGSPTIVAGTGNVASVLAVQAAEFAALLTSTFTGGTAGSTGTANPNGSVTWASATVGASPKGVQFTSGTGVAKIVGFDNLEHNGAAGVASEVVFTASNLGPRGDYIINRLRIYFTVAIATTVTKGSLAMGTGDDDVTLATDAISARSDLYYHSVACTATAGVTSADGGVGQYIQFIRDQSAPTVGFDCQVYFGLDCAQSNATAVCTSSSANAVRGAFFHVHNNDWSPPMIAAVCTAAKWVKETAYPAASMRGYTQTDVFNFPIPPPFYSTDRLSPSDIEADLNNGATPIDFTSNGGAIMPRQITSRSVLEGTSNKDYRARPGHIPSVLDAAWEYLLQRWLAVRQDMVTGDPPAGARPYKGFNTPGHMRALVFSAIDVLSSNNSPWGKPILDPDAIAAMKASVDIDERDAGFGVSVDWEPARHDYFDDFLILQGGAAY